MFSTYFHDKMDDAGDFEVEQAAISITIIIIAFYMS